MSYIQITDEDCLIPFFSFHPDLEWKAAKYHTHWNSPVKVKSKLWCGIFAPIGGLQCIMTSHF